MKKFVKTLLFIAVLLTGTYFMFSTESNTVNDSKEQIKSNTTSEISEKLMRWD